MNDIEKFKKELAEAKAEFNAFEKDFKMILKPLKTSLAGLLFRLNNTPKEILQKN